MGQAIVSIAGRSYRISCRDGDEERIARLGDGIAARAGRIIAAVGSVPEGQLLVMTALMLADELADARAGLAPASPPPAAPVVDIKRLTRIVERLETIAGSAGAHT